MLAIQVKAYYNPGIGTTMSTPVILSFLATLSVLCFLAVLVTYNRERSNLLTGANSPADPASSDRESFTEYYRPMARLLDARELAAARTLCGVAHADFDRFRKCRIAAFGSYLNDMRLDFNRIDFKMRYLLLSASANDADLVQQLNRLKFAFQVQVWRVEFQLLAYRLGFGTVEIAPLLKLLEQFEGGLLRWPSASAAAA